MRGGFQLPTSEIDTAGADARGCGRDSQHERGSPDSGRAGGRGVGAGTAIIDTCV